MPGYWKPEACGQTVLPDKSLLIGQKLQNETILVIFIQRESVKSRVVQSNASFSEYVRFYFE